MEFGAETVVERYIYRSLLILESPKTFAPPESNRHDAPGCNRVYSVPERFRYKDLT
jgi:hypothetical protein